MVQSGYERKNESTLRKYCPTGVDIVNFSIAKKYCLFTLFCVYITTCVGIFFNWISLSDFFYHGNVYIDQCSDWESGGPDHSHYKHSSNETYRCEEQDKKVQALYPIILCSNFIMSAVSGTFFDYFGPKVTALIGHGFNIIAWVLIGLQGGEINSSRHSNGNSAIILGAVFLGLSCDSAYIPILSLIYLFPNNHTIYTVILGCCASLSFAMPIFLDLFSQNSDALSFQLICYLYCFIILVPFFFILMVFLPWKHINKPNNEAEIEPSNNTLKELEGYVVTQEEQRKKGKELDTLRGANYEEAKRSECCGTVGHIEKGEVSEKCYLNYPLKTDCRNRTDQFNLQTEEILSSKVEQHEKNDNSLERINSFKEFIIEDVYNSSISSENRTPLILSKLVDGDTTSNNVSIRRVKRLCKNDGATSSNEMHEINCTKKKSLLINEYTIDKNNMMKMREQEPLYSFRMIWNDIGVIFFSLKYLSICYYFTVYNLSLVNYNECAKLFFKDYIDVQNTLKVFGPLSVFSCAMFGFLIHKFHILIIIFFLLTCSLFMYIFAVIKNKVFAYLSSVCYLIVTGCYTTQLYCYIQIMFPKRHFGKIAGTTSMISGLLSLLNIPIYNHFIVDHNRKDPTPFAYVVIALLFSTIPLLFLTYRRNARVEP
ncbi:major facilitator superfamily-related transporter, putative [Plasmodium ovale]|uniref:Major facilitator superfamily-related transporter, putative n=1 Tax=Plasmodium ovale TaxID=36330 RepID=A0A1C3KMR4_PLAOA|nr:major facilitator superfamily-related transporter, putative [Plasmodium ovale]